MPGAGWVAASRVSFDVDTDKFDAVIGRLVEHGLWRLTSQPPTTLEEAFLCHCGEEP